MTALANHSEYLAEMLAAELLAARILAAEESNTAIAHPSPSQPSIADQTTNAGEGTMANLQSSYRADMAVTVSTRRLIKGLQDVAANRPKNINGLS